MADSAGYEAERLLAQVGWVRQLARSLISDPDLADDVAQEAWLAALKSAPDRDRPLEPWLATVVRNFALRARRSAGRRAAREEAAAKPEALPSASDLYERAAVHKELVQAVLALDEPYKTTLLLRFLEELPPRTIAQRQGVPVRTVHTRLARGLAALRSRLDREHEDDRGHWLTGLIAFGGPPRSQVVAGSSAALAALAGVVIVLAVAFTVWLARRPGGTQELAHSAGGSGSGSGSLQASSPSPLALPAVSDARAPVGIKTTASAAQPPAAQADPAVLEGLVTDTDDLPIAGASVQALEPDHARMARFDPPLQSAWHAIASSRTDTAGRFRLQVPDGRAFALDVGATGFARAAVAGVRAGTPVHVRLQAGAVLAGTLIDGRTGAALEGAQVTARPQAWSAGPGPALYAAEDHGFAFADLPPGEIALEIVSLDRTLAARRTFTLRAGEQRRETIVVEPGATLRGRVVDRASGAPIADAQVGDDPSLARRVPTDSDGRFALAGFEIGARATLHARAEGYGGAARLLPAVADGLEVLFELERGRTARGRVLGPEGEPLGGAFVAAVADVWRGGVHESDRVTATTQADGTFALASLRADLPHQLLVAKSGCASLALDFPASESASDVVELGDARLARPASLRGTLIGDGGVPLAGSAVYLLRMGDVGVRARTADPSVFAAGRIWADDVADSAGRFAFVDLPAGAYYVATSRGKLHAEADLGEGETREVRLAE